MSEQHHFAGDAPEGRRSVGKASKGQHRPRATSHRQVSARPQLHHPERGAAGASPSRHSGRRGEAPESKNPVRDRQTDIRVASRNAGGEARAARRASERKGAPRSSRHGRSRVKTSSRSAQRAHVRTAEPSAVERLAAGAEAVVSRGVDVVQNVRGEHGTWNSQSGKPRDGKLIRPGGRSSGYGYVGAHQGLPSALRRQQKGPAGASLLSLSGGAAGRSFPWKPVALVAVLAMAIVCVLAFRGCAAGGGAAESDKPVDEQLAVRDTLLSEVPASAIDYDLNPIDFEQLSGEAGIQTFSLAGAQASELSWENEVALQMAVATMAAKADAGFVLVDVDTGSGVAYNVDAQVYGASSIKGPFATYVCEELIDAGRLSLTSSCPASRSIMVDLNGYYGTSASSYAVQTLLEASVTESDNNSFSFMRYAYTSLAWDEWVSSLGADELTANTSDKWWPFVVYSARSSIEVWAETYNYLQTGSEASQLLSGWLGDTSVSFLRDAISSTGATVQNKAGWCPDSEGDYAGVCDAGIVQLDGHTYLMSVMTGLSDSTSARESFQDFAAAIFAVRGDL